MCAWLNPRKVLRQNEVMDDMSNPDPISTFETPLKSGVTPPPSTSRSKTVVIALLFLALVVVGAWWMRHQRAATDRSASPAARAELPPVPVVDGTVARKDIPIYLEGLGTVQAFNTVTIRARVDGQLEKVAFTEGQEIHAGDLLAQIDPSPYRAQMEQAVARKGQDEAQLANARLDVQRYADLLKNEGVTEQVYETQKALVSQLEAAVKADQAAIESAKVQLNYTTILSPIDGHAGIRLVDQGNLVHANDANGLVVITQMKPISVVFTLPEQTLGSIQNQVTASGPDLTVIAIGHDNKTVLGTGKLAVIDNQIDITTGTIKLKATFPNTDLRLWPGQFVTARLLLTVRKDAAVVPASVIQRGPDGTFAFVINENQTVEVRPVKVGQIDQGEALVDEGLKPGERVVVDGQYKLQKGSRVKTSEAPEASGRSTNSSGPGEKKGSQVTGKKKQ
jgi:membrane fusion protein, multidrug efflux system